MQTVKLSCHCCVVCWQVVASRLLVKYHNFKFIKHLFCFDGIRLRKPKPTDVLSTISLVWCKFQKCGASSKASSLATNPIIN